MAALTCRELEAGRRLRSGLDEAVDAGAELAREGVVAGRAMPREAFGIGNDDRVDARRGERGLGVIHAPADIVAVVDEVHHDQARAGLDASHDLLPFGARARGV